MYTNKKAEIMKFIETWGVKKLLSASEDFDFNVGKPFDLVMISECFTDKSKAFEATEEFYEIMSSEDLTKEEERELDEVGVMLLCVSDINEIPASLIGYYREIELGE